MREYDSASGQPGAGVANRQGRMELLGELVGHSGWRRVSEAAGFGAAIKDWPGSMLPLDCYLLQMRLQWGRCRSPLMEEEVEVLCRV